MSQNSNCPILKIPIEDRCFQYQYANKKNEVVKSNKFKYLYCAIANCYKSNDKIGPKKNNKSIQQLATIFRSIKGTPEVVGKLPVSVPPHETIWDHLRIGQFLEERDVVKKLKILEKVAEAYPWMYMQNTTLSPREKPVKKEKKSIVIMGYCVKLDGITFFSVGNMSVKFKSNYADMIEWGSKKHLYTILYNSDEDAPINHHFKSIFPESELIVRGQFLIISNKSAPMHKLSEKIKEKLAGDIPFSVPIQESEIYYKTKEEKKSSKVSNIENYFVGFQEDTGSEGSSEELEVEIDDKPSLKRRKDDTDF
jgi:hypothetical protein